MRELMSGAGAGARSFILDVLSSKVDGVSIEQPDAVAALRLADEQGLTFDPGSTVYVVGRNTPIVTGKRTMAMWRKRLFALMARNSQVAYRYFGVPTHRLLEVGGQTEL